MAVGMARSSAIVLGAALASLLAGGAGAFESSHSTTTCPRLGEAVRLPLRPGGSPLQADVDGDGRRDRATLRYAPHARVSCGFVLVVKTASRVFAVRIPESYKPSQDMKMRDWPFPQPYLAAAVRLEADRSQIVVERWRGAAVADVSLYGVIDGKLALLRFHPRRTQDQLSLFGTVGTGVSNARCVAGGPMVVITTWPKDPNGTLWSLRRSEYRLSSGGLWRTRTRRFDGSRREIDTLAHRWGMDAAPFTGCVVARGRRL